VTPRDVELMFATVETWQELLCLSVLAYTGIRRSSAAGPRWREVDLASGTKVIWEAIVELGDRVGVKVTVHELRRAFAVAFLTSHPGALESLQALMSHSRIDTTEVYLRALNP
jgi:integrase